MKWSEFEELARMKGCFFTGTERIIIYIVIPMQRSSYILRGISDKRLKRDYTGD